MILLVRQYVGAAAGYELILQLMECILTTGTILANGMFRNLGFLKLEIGLGRQRFCLTDDCMCINSVFIVTIVISSRGERSAKTNCLIQRSKMIPKEWMREREKFFIP